MFLAHTVSQQAVEIAEAMTPAWFMPEILSRFYVVHGR